MISKKSNSKRVVTTSGILFGKPRIKGSRVSVEQVLGCLAEGWSHKKITRELGISEKDITACIDFAYHSLSRMRFLKSSSGHIHA